MATEDNKEKIAATALQMFSLRGLKGVTMDDIAQALHISKRTLYETYANKEELLLACLKQVHDRTNAMHRHAHSQVGEPMLVAMYMLRTNALFIQRYRRIIEETERYYPDIHDRFFKVHSGALREILRKGMEYARERGYLRPDADTELAIGFFCTVIQNQRLSDMTDIEACTRKINEVCYTYMRGLMSTDTLARYDREEGRYATVLANLKTDMDTEPDPHDNNNEQ